MGSKKGEMGNGKRKIGKWKMKMGNGKWEIGKGEMGNWEMRNKK
jgi:hypothetical protein